MTTKNSWIGRILLVAALGAVGGAINGWLLLVELPVAFDDNPSFQWTVVPSGAAHGALLAIVPVVAGVGLARWRLRWRILAAPLVGWVAGYASWIPLEHSVMESDWLESLGWPWKDGVEWFTAWAPFFNFGVVGLLLHLIVLIRGPGLKRWSLPVLTVCAGVLGSLWFWLGWGPWYFAAIHGTIWGLLVGSGVSGLRYRRNAAALPGCQ